MPRILNDEPFGTRPYVAPYDEMGYPTREYEALFAMCPRCSRSTHYSEQVESDGEPMCLRCKEEVES